jgi:hypothetical protein
MSSLLTDVQRQLRVIEHRLHTKESASLSNSTSVSTDYDHRSNLGIHTPPEQITLSDVDDDEDEENLL